MQPGESPRRPEAQYATDRYLPVFLLLVTALGTATFAGSSRLARAVVSLAVLGAVLGTLRATGSAPQRMRIASIGTALLAVGVVVAGVFDLSFAAAGVILAIAATMGYAGFALVRRILEQQRIGIREVVAALAAYVMIALVFAFAYNAVGLASAEDFFSGGKPEEIGNFAYFSVVTITTLGYGDLTPATNLGRSLVIMETLFGQIFLVVLVAYLVGSLGRDRPTRALD